MQGWIKDYRKELESDIWSMPPLYHRIWQYLKYKVNHEPRYLPSQNGKIYIGEGETITSLRQIAENVAWVENKAIRVPAAETIRKVLSWLAEENMITRTSDTRGTRIKVVNYSIYQGNGYTPMDTKKTPRGHGVSTNKNVKNEKNDNKTPYAEFVKMTEAEYKKLVDKHGQAATDKMIEILDNYKGAKGATYKSDYRAILSWVVKRYEEDKAIHVENKRKEPLR